MDMGVRKSTEDLVFARRSSRRHILFGSKEGICPLMLLKERV